ncbi:tetratricopeptide repeat protein [Halomonas maura]|uniref:tetratricopeptide repeat protein n=1 Tax=Halomonas maura TaxID=117606 RepID=UPI0025B4BE2B|nr:tetratricopeptide repeat protein [Halomonas maura]MDN3555546.1 tetratricopeptide repeat protein [Halomonas maura]
MTFARRPLAALGLSLLLGGCQSLSPQPVTADPMVGAPPITQGLDAQGLSSLLVAELAGQRGDYRRATRGYLETAERYGSVALAERAALAARFDEDPQLLEEAARRWQALAPESSAPARLLASLAMQRGDWTTALDQRLAVVDRGGEGELLDFAERALEAGTDPLPLLALLRRHLADTTAAPPDAELATALLEAAAGEYRAARQRLERLAARAPELPALWRIRAVVALDSEAPQQAKAAARRGLTLAPGDPRLMLLTAQAEIRLGNLAAAEANTDALLEDHGDTPELRLALARLYLEEGHPRPARRLLLPLIGDDAAPPLAFLLLGSIADEEGEVDNALLYYRQVPEGERFLLSRARAARMLVEHDRLLDARTFLRIERLRHEAVAPELVALEVELLDEAGARDQADALLVRSIDQYPDATRLRYQRAMRAYEDGDLAAMESHLRAIIEREPDNANALNALGFTLADMNLAGRLDEAQRLIERAHELAPDNPAILDSLGWVYYRRGDPEAALPWLERAWTAMPDQEVAAHLIEVLWQLGERERARDLLETARDRFDPRPAIEALRDRLPALTP